MVPRRDGERAHRKISIRTGCGSHSARVCWGEGSCEQQTSQKASASFGYAPACVHVLKLFLRGASHTVSTASPARTLPGRVKGFTPTWRPCEGGIAGTGDACVPSRRHREVRGARLTRWADAGQNGSTPPIWPASAHLVSLFSLCNLR